jgi:hypothetical protein
MTHLIRLAAVAALGAGLAAASGIAQASPAPDAAAQHQRAARSTEVTLVNKTKCLLTLRSKDLYHGIWYKDPVQVIQPGATDVFGTESDGFMTGTEAAVNYLASGCIQAGRRVRFHWANPWIGRNGYDWGNTDPVFNTHTAGGGGNNAQVTATVSTRSGGVGVPSA